MKPTVHIIASCTDRKRMPVPEELRLRRMAHASASARADRWWNRLSEHGSATVPAVELYAGDHWSVARTLPEVAETRGFRAHLWIASAGYGLVPADAPLRSYSATFAGGQLDSVVLPAANGGRSSDFTRDWWRRLSELPGPVRNTPRSVVDIVRSDPRAHIVMFGSPDYVAAMESDLLAAVAAASYPDRIIVISSRARFAHSGLGPHLIPSEARLQRKVGGARTSLHARVARKILDEVNEWELSAAVLRAHYTRVLASSADVQTFDRTRLTDRQLQRFIRTELRRAPSTSCTRALRALRDGGQACEQSRFKQLFHEVCDASE